jgi:predicted DNA-binding transcriptional regulator YafY
MGQYEAIRNILKSWIPHIVILEPEELKKNFLADVRRWIQKQEKL